MGTESKVKTKFVLGVTGGIGTGKTVVTNMFQDMGCKVIDADEIAHQVLEKKNIKNKIKKTFGDMVIDGENKVDRKRLGEIVFSSAELLNKLENIVHPHIIDIIKRKIKMYKTGIIILSAPLLYELNLKNLVNKVLVVSASKKEQIKRLMSRDNISRDQAIKRINLQMALKEKIKNADYVISTTNKNLSTIKKEVKNLYNKIIKKQFSD